MKPTRKFIPLALATAIFATETNTLQAADFSFQRAVWRSSKELLLYKGYGEPGSTVDVYISDTLISLGSTEVDANGKWSLISNSNEVPCAVRAESGSDSASRRVKYAPANCVNSDNIDDNNPPPPKNNPPVISGSPRTSIQEGRDYRFTPTASDPDGDRLRFSAQRLPTWASINRDTGVITGQPGPNTAGSYPNIVVTVSDGQAQARLAPFEITVTEEAPNQEGGTIQFSRGSQSVEEGNTATVTITRSNSSGRTSVNYGTFGVTARNREDYSGTSWTALNFQDGESRKSVRVPTLSDSEAEGNETFEVHLGSPNNGYTLGSRNTTVVTIQDDDAQNQNTPPTISGRPSTNVVAGQPYAFSPNASDADNDDLTFQIQHRPTWATFDEDTGVLRGTPTEAHAGSYDNIVISVSDGTARASLRSFNVTVAASDTGGTTGDITLSWVAPSTRTDGSALSLSEIAGYRVYMGNSANNLSPIVDLDNGNSERHVVEDLENGTYYFAISVYDTAGNESGLSNVVSKQTM
jgi:hypothetical protein